MNDFLTNLISRSFTATPAIHPYLPSLFESAPVEPFTEEPPTASPPVAASSPPPAEQCPTAALAPEFWRARRQPSQSINDIPPPNDAGSEERVRDGLGKCVALQTISTSSTAPSPGAVFPAVSRPAEAIPPPQSPTLRLNRAIVPQKRTIAPRQFEPQQETAVPAIHVTIGRVEVRAIHAPAPAAKPTKRAVPTLSLDDYLQRRSGGGR